MSDRTFANGAPMDTAAAEATHRAMYPGAYAQPVQLHNATAAEIAAGWSAEAAELTEFEELSTGPDRDRPAAPVFWTAEGGAVAALGITDEEPADECPACGRVHACGICGGTAHETTDHERVTAGLSEFAPPAPPAAPAAPRRRHAAPVEGSDAQAAADELAMARDLEATARDNLAGLQQDMRDLAARVVDAGQELHQAEERVAFLAPAGPTARTVTEVRAYVTGQRYHYDQVAARMLTSQGRDLMATAAAAMAGIQKFIDGES